MAADGGANDKAKKKRLKLMPEILPEPKRAIGTGSARQRTIKTMERLIAVSAASALIAGAEATGGCGYGVVDPLPPPSHCPNIASTIAATAKWKLDGSAFVIVLDLSASTKLGVSYVDTAPTVYNQGTLVSHTLNQGALTATIQSISGAQSVGLYVDIHCAEGNASLTVYVQTANITPADGASIPVTVYDGY